MKKQFLSVLAKAINSYLRLDPESKPRLEKLRGKIIAIEFEPLSFTCQCVFDVHGVDIQAHTIAAADTTIRGTPLQMLGTMLAHDKRQRFFADDLSIEGDAELGQQVVELFDALQIDWEEYLSHLVGDIPAYHAGNYLRKMKNWLGHADDSLTQNINEFVHEETNWLPSREALQDFFTDIDTLHTNVDRIEARIKKLSTQLIGDQSQ